MRKRSSNLASRLELGRLPLENYIKVQSLLYFARLHNNNINPLLKESFEVCKVLDSQNVYCWYTYINDMMPKDMIEMDKLSSCKTKKDIKSLKPVLKSELKNHYIKLSNLYIECLTEQNKLFLHNINSIVQGFLPLYNIRIGVGDPVIRKGGWDPIN